MISRFEHLRARALSLRKQGKSIRNIESTLGIPRSTLSGWLRDVPLTKPQLRALEKQRASSLVSARIKASEVHRARKQTRIRTVKTAVDMSYPDIHQSSAETIEIALAMLYLGEGAKTNSRLGLGSSDAMIMRFYVRALERLYSISPSQLRVDLHLRDDQDEIIAKKYWSRAIGIPLNRFLYVSKDKRTIGKPTYEGYNGVCYVGGGGVEIQRRLMYLAEVFCKGITTRG